MVKQNSTATVQTNRKKNITRFLMLAGILVLLNIISTRLHVRYDATAEKRFSLSEPTKRMLKNLKETAVIEVYLKGNFPAEWKKLAESTEELLRQFNEHSNGKVRFSFINPIEGKSEKEKNEIFTQLGNKGINPVMISGQMEEEDGYQQKLLFPAAKISYNQKETSLSLLENFTSLDPLEKLNYSATMLEYKFISAFKTLIEPDRKKIAYLVGHGEAIGYNTFDMLATLEKNYDVDTFDLTQNIDIGKYYSAAIICKPTVPFDEKNKFKIDQYVMQGGRLLMMLDMLRFDNDSLKYSEASMAADYGLNLDDMLFNFGARLNGDFVEDYQQCLKIPVVVGMNGNQPDIDRRPWLFFPFSISNAKHPIVNNLDAVMFMYAGSIDTVANPGIKKTVLLTTSNKSRRMPSPIRISLANLKFKPQADQFKEKNIPLAVLLEGKFKSTFANRIDPAFITVYTDSLKKQYATACERDNRMIVVSDGDMFLNDIDSKIGPLECGTYKYGEYGAVTYANKTFVLNSIEYLTDDYGLLEARNKTLTLRLLDKAKIKQQKLTWQLVNIALPAALLLVFSSGFFFFRRKKYEGRVD